MTKAEYQKLTNRKIRTGIVLGTEKFFVKALNQLSNDCATVPAGTVLQLTGKGKGLTAEGQECKNCGTRQIFTGLMAEHIELISQ
jgi:hypothetical protein